MNIRNITNDLPKSQTLTYDRRALADITHVAIHHSTGNPRVVTVQGIARYHSLPPPTGAGFAGIGYHFVIDMDGNIYQTNDLETIAAHVWHQNSYTAGICLIGSFVNGSEPPDAQRLALAELLAWLCPMVSVPLERVWGHKTFPDQNTTCPGDTWDKWGLRAIDEARAIMAGEARMWTEHELRQLITGICQKV
jgi:hypothetical protein